MERIACQHGSARTIRWMGLVGMLLLAGCRVLTIDEDRMLRARRGADFDAARYVEQIWKAKAIPALVQKAVPADRLSAAIQAGLDRAGADYGRRVGDGSAWTFVVRGAGTVSSIDTASRHGSVEVALPGGTLRLQTGPVVSGTAIRDALPFVSFNDFADQLVFADVGRALTRRSLDDLHSALIHLRPGQPIRFLGVVNVRERGEPLVVTPVAITVGGAG